MADSFLKDHDHSLIAPRTELSEDEVPHEILKGPEKISEEVAGSSVEFRDYCITPSRPELHQGEVPHDIVMGAENIRDKMTGTSAEDHEYLVIPPRPESSAEEVHHGILKELWYLHDSILRCDRNRNIRAVIQLWKNLEGSIATSKYMNEAFTALLRKTTLYILAPVWNIYREEKRKKLFDAIRKCGPLLNPLMPKFGAMCSNIQILSVPDPWKIHSISFEVLLSGELSVDDPSVQAYFKNEPLEIVMSRVHYFFARESYAEALCLAKYAMKFYSVFHHMFRHVRDLSEGSSEISHANGKEYSPVYWITRLISMKRGLGNIAKEMKVFNAHEAMHILLGLRADGHKVLAHLLTESFIRQELLEPQSCCCLKDLIVFWCCSEKERKFGLEDVTRHSRTVFAEENPTHMSFYLLMDAVWEEFGQPFTPLIVEFFVRGAVRDINYLEYAKMKQKKENIDALQKQLAFLFIKLSTLFGEGYEYIVRECLLSAFFLRPTQELLSKLTELTSILRSEAPNFRERQDRVMYKGLQDLNPLLTRGIENVSPTVISDMVIVLEAVRPSIYDFSLASWEKTKIELENYLKSRIDKANREFVHNLLKAKQSNTASEEDSSSFFMLDSCNIRETHAKLRKLWFSPPQRAKSAMEEIYEEALKTIPDRETRHYSALRKEKEKDREDTSRKK